MFSKEAQTSNIAGSTRGGRWSQEPGAAAHAFVRLLVSALVSTCLCAPLLSHAQDADKVRPKVPGDDGIIRLTQSEGQRPGAVRPGSNPNKSGGVQMSSANENAQLLSSLVGLVFVNSPDEVKASGVSGVQGVQANTDDVLASPEFDKLASKYIGQPVTLTSLKELNRDVVAFYAEHDFPVVDVVIPAQDITGGDVQLVVIKGHVGKVTAEGNKHFSDKLLTSMIREHPGDVVRQSKMASDIAWLNHNPFRHVDLVYARGEQPGDTDIILQTKDRFPLRVYGGYEDSGNKFTGDNRWNVGFNWGNVFGLDHQLNYQYTFNNNSKYFAAHSGTYVVPLPWWHNTFSVFGSYAETSVKPGTLPGGISSLNLRGKSYQLSPRYTVPLPNFGNYSHEFSLGYDFKRSNNNLEFGGQAILSSEADVSQMVFTYSSELADKWGRTTFVANTFWSPGGMTHLNKDSDFEAFRDGASADYLYARFEAQRVQQLPYDFTLFGKITAQMSNENLLGSEQLGAGGYATVRGYEERAANADGGLIFNLEARTPAISLLKYLGKDDLQDQFQFLLFYDYAHLSNHRPTLTEKKTYNLASFGPGMRYTIPPYLTVRFDYGFQLRDPHLGMELDRHRAGRMDLGILLAY